MNMLSEWLFAALFWVGALLFAAGLFMIILPAKFMRATERLNRWVATDDFFRPLDEQIRLERLFYRYHYVTGLLVVVGAIYSLIMLTRLFDLMNFLDAGKAGFDLTVGELVSDGLLVCLYVGNILALLLGLIVIARPSLLKGLEHWSNTWMETEKLKRVFDQPVYSLEDKLPRYPRLIGGVALIGSLYILSATAVFVLG